LPADASTRREIEEMFTTRVKTLRAKRSANGSPAQASESKAQLRRYSRRSSVWFPHGFGAYLWTNVIFKDYNRRMKIAEKYSQLQPLASIIERLGVEGMSSDESDFQPGTTQKQYFIKQPEWRAPEFRTLMSTLDHIHALTRSLDFENDARGQMVRRRNVRLDSNPSQRSNPPTHLPLNFYSQVWLNNQPEFYVEDILQPQTAVDIPNGLNVAAWVLFFLFFLSLAK
jgi:hypothetical protein